MGTVSIQADSITAMAKTVISMTELHSPYKGVADYSFHLEPGVIHCDEVPPQAWLSNMRDLQLYVSHLFNNNNKYINYSHSESGSGNGPLRGLMRALVAEIVANDQYWVRMGSDYAVLQFTQLQPLVRLRKLWADGTLAAIHIQTTLAGPDPISPWLLYAAMCSSDLAWDDLDYSFIESLDPDAAKTLQPWFLVNAGTIFAASDFTSPVSLLLNHYCNLQASAL